MKLIVGLGNPGVKYAATRHNIGFMVAERLAAASGIALKKKGHQGLYGVGKIAGCETLILLPQTFMNRSGVSVNSALKSLGAQPGDLVVVHDEIDLPFGQVRIKAGGGHGGHNGIRSICDAIGSRDFVRIRVGVGRPPGEGDVSGYVLGPFGAAEKKCLDDVLDGSTEAIIALLVKGEQAAMNDFNNRRFAIL